MVYVATPNANDSERPPDPGPVQQAQLPVCSVSFASNQPMYPVTVEPGMFAGYTDSCYTATPGADVTQIYQPDHVTPQHQPHVAYQVNNVNPFIAGHCHADMTQIDQPAQPATETTNPFLPSAEIWDNALVNPFTSVHDYNNTQTEPLPLTTEVATPMSYPTNGTAPEAGLLAGFQFVDGNANIDPTSKCLSWDMGGDVAGDITAQTTQGETVDNQEYLTSSKTRCDSESSEEIFTSAYTDTISSINSTDYLIKASDSEPEETIHEEEPAETYYNDGFTSYSSSEEALNEEKEDTESDNAESESQPLLGESEGTETESADGQQEQDSSPPDVQKIEEFVHHHLVPIVENDILTINIEEVEPCTTPLVQSSPYKNRITNNFLHVVDESFLFQSQTNLSESDGKRAGTMHNLHERQSFLDLTAADISKVGRACQKALIYLKDDMTFGSLASLNNMAAKGMKDPNQAAVSLIEGSSEIEVVASNRHTSNVIALSFCVTLLFIAIGSVRNLQSSLNQEGGVGMISMAVSFVGYMLGSIASVSIVQTFQPRMCIILSLIPNLLYVAANIYPTMWLMVPISLVQGVSTAILWNAMSTYITFLSRGQALLKGVDFERMSGKYFGIFCLIYQIYHIVGNLIASLVLMAGGGHGSPAATPNVSAVRNVTANITALVNAITANPLDTADNGAVFEVMAPMPLGMDAEFDMPAFSQNQTLSDVTHLRLCGAEFCSHYTVGGSGVTVTEETKYTLFGIYMGCILLSMAIAIFLLEPLNTRLFTSAVSPVQRVKEQLLSLTKFAVDANFLLLLPLLMYSIMQFGFVSAEVTMAFVTCPLGIHMVGYTMICFGVCGSVSSYVSGLTCNLVGRVPLFSTAAILNLGILVYMTQWQPTLDSLVPYFVVMGIWGVSDGIWISQVNSLMGVVFSDRYEEAYAGLRVAQGLGVAILFGYSNSICMAVKIYIMISLCIIAMACYIIMEGLTRYRKKQKLVILKQTSV